MFRTATPLLSRLRRHRGLWALAILVLMIKLVSSSVCLSDDPSARMTSAQVESLVTLVDQQAADAPDEGACLLDEAGACHCACAHAATLTTVMAPPIAPAVAGLASIPLSLGLVPDTTGSLLRPPIA